MEGYTFVMASVDLPAEKLYGITCGQVDLLLLRRGGVVSCFYDRCSHQDIKLSRFGSLKDEGIYCNAHGAVFAEDGAVLCEPANRPLTCYDVVEKDGGIYVKML